MKILKFMSLTVGLLLSQRQKSWQSDRWKNTQTDGHYQYQFGNGHNNTHRNIVNIKGSI